MRSQTWGKMLAVAALVTASEVALAQEQIATLALDASSYISYSDTATVQVPAGSTIRFRFGNANRDGSIPITVRPTDVSIAPIAVAEGATITYTLGSIASGTLRKMDGARTIELDATLVATLRESAEVPAVAYQLRFTTGTAQAVNTSQTDSVSVDGSPPTATNHVQLVGAATNQPDAFPGPGEAVYAVLSGTFDLIPNLP